LAEGPSQSEKRSLARIAEQERMVGKLTMENETFKKGRAIHSTAEKRAFITNHRQDFGSFERRCEVMGLSHKTYYYRSAQVSLKANCVERLDL